MTWYPLLGYGVFWIALFTAIVLYAVKRKWYPVAYLISASLYIFTVGFVMDVFDLSKNGILFLLALSAALMIGAGLYLSKRFGD